MDWKCMGHSTPSLHLHLTSTFAFQTQPARKVLLRRSFCCLLLMVSFTSKIERWYSSVPDAWLKYLEDGDWLDWEPSWLWACTDRGRIFVHVGLFFCRKRKALPTSKHPFHLSRTGKPRRERKEAKADKGGGRMGSSDSPLRSCAHSGGGGP